MKLYLIGAVLILTAGAGAFEGFKAGELYKAASDEKATRAKAIANNCGAYDAKTGEFAWVQVETAQSLVMSDVSLQRAAQLSTSQPAPIPQQKPHFSGRASQ